MFVELERNDDLPKNVVRLVRDVENVTGMMPWQFRFYKNDKFYHLDEQNISNIVPTSPEQYSFLTDDTVDEDIDTLFAESKVTVKRTGKN